MLGYDISWAGFNIIEVMSSSRFTCKRIGYLAASQSFHPDSELLMLTTNMIRKDLNSQNQYDAGVALSSLSCFISPDLSRDLANDIMTLMSSTKPYLRMKAVLMMYKVFLRYPEALRPAFPKLKEKLEDPDPGVQSAAVNVICELARKNPKNYLPLAPIFFKLMTTSTNNWMLIKIIKLFGALTPLEPRLGKKLIEPLTNLIHSTSAMSLLYECINTVIAVLISISSGMPNHSASIQLCVQKLRILIEDSDQNLKYLGLLAMSKILKTHPKSVQSHKDLILACLDDKDESIRLRALDLLYGMVSKKNLMEIVKRLLGHMERAEGSVYRDELLFKVIEICSQSSYLYVTNFEWYLTVLVELITLEAGSKHGGLIAEQLLDVAIRVPVVRQFAVNEMSSLLDTFAVSSQSDSMYEVLYAAAFIVGEFSSELNDAESTLNILLRPRQVPGHIKGVFVQNVIKIFTRLVTTCLENQDIDGIVRLCDHVLAKLQEFSSSNDIEVQERANSACVLIEMLRAQFEKTHPPSKMNTNHNHINIINTTTTTTKDIISGLETVPDDCVDSNNLSKKQTVIPVIPTLAIEIVQEMALLFAGELIPVAPKAQRKVPLPDMLDLDEWINAPSEKDSSSSSDEEKEELFAAITKNHDPEGIKRSKSDDLTPEQLEKYRQQRLLEQSNNPHYLKSNDSKKTETNSPTNDADAYVNLDEIPIAELSLEVPLQVLSMKRSDKYLEDEKKPIKEKKKHKKSKKSKKSKNKVAYTTSESEDDTRPTPLVNTTLDMPEGVALSDSEDKDKFDPDDPHRALNIDLEIPDVEKPKKSKKPANENNNTTSNENLDPTKKSKSKKSKEPSSNNSTDGVPTSITTAENTKKEKNKKDKEHKEHKSKSKSKQQNEESQDLMGTPVKKKKDKSKSSSKKDETNEKKKEKKEKHHHHRSHHKEKKEENLLLGDFEETTVPPSNEIS